MLAAQADPAAFHALYDRYYPRVFRYLAARTATEEEAADLTQVVFLKAFDNLGRFRSGGAPFASWLFRITRNVAVDAHRRRKPTVAWDFALEEASSSASPEDQVLRTERLLALRAAIRNLTPEKRELLALRYAGCLTAVEIAPLVGKNPEAVKKQLQRTLRELKEHARDWHE